MSRNSVRKTGSVTSSGDGGLPAHCAGDRTQDRQRSGTHRRSGPHCAERRTRRGAQLRQEARAQPHAGSPLRRCAPSGRTPHQRTGRVVLRHPLDCVPRGRPRPNPHVFTNPYLALGVSFGSPGLRWGNRCSGQRSGWQLSGQGTDWQKIGAIAAVIAIPIAIVSAAAAVVPILPERVADRSAEPLISGQEAAPSEPDTLGPTTVSTPAQSKPSSCEDTSELTARTFVNIVWQDHGEARSRGEATRFVDFSSDVDVVYTPVLETYHNQCSHPENCSVGPSVLVYTNDGVGPKQLFRSYDRSPCGRQALSLVFPPRRVPPPN